MPSSVHRPNVVPALLERISLSQPQPKLPSKPCTISCTARITIRACSQTQQH